jgi:hypothetical protein
MKVRLTRNYTPPPEWGLMPYPSGLVVHGQLAQWAIRDGAGVVVGPDLEMKITPPPEQKRRGRPRKEVA